MAWNPLDARTWLDEHVNLEAVVAGRPEPDLARMRRLCALMGDPQAAYPVIHLTGTNGKGSTTRMISALLAAQGLSVGMYTSPDLESLNERLAVTHGRFDAFDDDSGAAAGSDVGPLWDGMEEDDGDGDGEEHEDRAGDPHRNGLDGEPDRPDRIGDPAPAKPEVTRAPPAPESVSDDELADLLEALAALEGLLDSRPTRFEILTAAAFRWFADQAVDVAVVEVGLGGLFDATNVADGQVAVVTNVSLDHQEILGPYLSDIAREKAGIVKVGSTLVLGEIGADLAPLFRDAGAARVVELGVHFGVTADRVAVGGRLVSLRMTGADHDDVFLPVHGAHQATNAALAVAAAEAFFDRPLADDVVSEAFAGLRLPGRMEVLGHRPLVLLDGAHNEAGARAAAATVAEEFGGGEDLVAVVGMLRGRDPGEMLRALGLGTARLVLACPAPSPRSLPAAEIAGAARDLGVEARELASVAEALDAAFAAVTDEGRVLVTGSLYVVGAARALLRGRLSGVGDGGAGR